MSETPPPRRPLATFLRATPAAPSLIATPAVPPAEPPAQAPPVPASGSPPAPAPELVAAPPAPLVPAPAAAVVPAPQSATGTPDHDGFQASVSSEARLPATDAALMSTAATAPAVEPAAGPIVDPHRAAPAGSTATTTDTDTTASQQIARATERQPQGDRASSHTRPAATEPAAASALADDDVAGDVDIAPHDAAAAQFQPLPVPSLAAPAFARRGIGRPRLRASGRQWALLAGLVGLLGVQIVVADRAHLASNARWRPLVSAACTLARCTLPEWREPAALTLLNREVRPLQGVAGVLQIQASFRNDARWAQAWPWLQLSLSDADGRVIGTRVLSPQEYLGQSPASQDTLAPGQAVQVAFRVREPAASTAAFSFDFR